VVAEAVKVLDAADRRFDLKLEFEHFELGGDRYLRTGETLPGTVLEELRQVDAILFGAIGHPDVAPGILERGIILRLRRELDLYVNLRPVKLLAGAHSPLRDKTPADVDFVVVRENTEGLYAGMGGTTGRGTGREVATEVSVNTRFAVERCVRFAFELAAARPDPKVTFCGKTNVLIHGHDLWDRVFCEVAAEFPDVRPDYANVDATCVWMVESPERFDVIVTDNMFGDIITDLGAAIQGGLGVAAGANLNPGRVSMFEPIGGTAPDLVGTGQVSPLAAIGAAAMLLEHTGHSEASAALGGAVAAVAQTLPEIRAGAMGRTTTEIGDLVAEQVGGGAG
jgi:3-isopropylmalate dehydrogenase